MSTTCRMISLDPFYSVVCSVRGPKDAYGRETGFLESIPEPFGWRATLAGKCHCHCPCLIAARLSDRGIRYNFFAICGYFLNRGVAVTQRMRGWAEPRLRCYPGTFLQRAPNRIRGTPGRGPGGLRVENPSAPS